MATAVAATARSDRGAGPGRRQAICAAATLLALAAATSACKAPPRPAETCPTYADQLHGPQTTSVQAARVLWVDIDSRGGTCSDERPREQVSKSTPWCTLAPAGTRVVAGDTVRVRAGEYFQAQECPRCSANAVLQVVVSGRPDAWIRYLAEPGEVVRIVPAQGAAQGVSVIETADKQVRPRFIEISGFRIHGAEKNCVEVKRTADVVLRDLDVSGCGSGAVELHQTARVTLESSRIHDSALAGWTSAVDLFLCGDGHVVRGNRIWSNRDADERRSEGHGITMDFCKQCGGALIENNVIWNNDGWCMAIFVSDGAIIRNNTCWRNGQKEDGSGEISVLGSRHTVRNNILVPNDGAPALSIRDRNDEWFSDWATVVEDFNLLWAPGHDRLVRWGGQQDATVESYRASNGQGWGAHTLQADPALADPAGADFRPRAGSPAIDSAHPQDAPPADATGRLRPRDGNGDGNAAADRGAHEH